MIIVDGRTDREKLVELLNFPEETHLEFKSILDFKIASDQLNFVKDAIAMSNRPPGGYILVGVSDEGSLVLPVGSISDRKRFDGARLSDLLTRHTDGEVHVISQVHEIDDHEVVLIYLPPHRDGLPLPMSKLGQYSKKPGETEVVFRVGDVLVREGPKNAPLRYAHWYDLLRRRDQRLRDEARAQVDSLIGDLAAALRSNGTLGPALVPLTLEMNAESFRESLISHLEAGSDIRVRQFLGEATAFISQDDRRELALDRLTIVAAQAMHFERTDLVRIVVDRLFDAYGNLEPTDAAARLGIITRVYVLGSLAVRVQQWSIVRDLVLRPYPTDPDMHPESSWIRHGQVQASRAELFPKGRGGMMISGAQALGRS